jgi:hypothetical protein
MHILRLPKLAAEVRVNALKKPDQLLIMRRVVALGSIPLEQLLKNFCPLKEAFPKRFVVAVEEEVYIAP